MRERDRFVAALARHQQRMRIAAVAAAFVIAAVAAAAASVLLSLAGWPPPQVRMAATAVVAGVTGVAAAIWWRRCTRLRVAGAIESRIQGLENLVITAGEVVSGRRVVHPIVNRTLLRDANDRLQAIPAASVQSLAAPLLLAVMISAAAALVILAGPQAPPDGGDVPGGRQIARTQPLETGELRVSVTPPAYSGRAATTVRNPSQVTVIEGSRVRIEAARAEGQLQAASPGREPIAFELDDDRLMHEFTAAESQVLLIQRVPQGEREGTDRLLHVRVDLDRRPLVRIRAPARDLIFGEPRGRVPVEIEARDDLGLASLALRYTRVAGSGETFTFTEGDIPVQIRRTSDGDWQGHATLALEALELVDGDTLVYRAVATDRKPGADPAASDAFLVEIGRLAGAASTGFAIPEERDRQAISQQMLIIKTERLDRARPTLARDAYQEQARLLAIEQRMVKAEFVFMTGGEVADEVAEAEHAHELVEGRFENAAQLELLTAIREMSRAEARLNAADTTQALTFERAALAALQRAFDRRRYLLRTLPERTRVDPARRLAGDRSAAHGSARPLSDPAVDPAVAHARHVMIDLGTAVTRREGLGAGLAARILAVDPTSAVLQRAAAALASQRAIDERVMAAREAQEELSAYVRAHLAAPSRQRIVFDPLRGRLAGEAARLGARQ